MQAHLPDTAINSKLHFPFPCSSMLPDWHTAVKCPHSKVTKCAPLTGVLGSWRHFVALTVTPLAKVTSQTRTHTHGHLFWVQGASPHALLDELCKVKTILQICLQYAKCSKLMLRISSVPFFLGIFLVLLDLVIYFVSLAASTRTVQSS